jgi:hypothetical protein
VHVLGPDPFDETGATKLADDGIVGAGGADHDPIVVQLVDELPVPASMSVLSSR